MRTLITNLFVALTATLAIAATSNAQTGSFAQPGQQIQTQTQALTLLPPTMPPQTQNEFYFGMRVELVRNWGGATLRVVSVDYGSPAQMAGLEMGDEIRTINGRGFAMARDSFDAVRIMNQAVSSSGIVPMGPAPSGVAAAVVWPGPQPNPMAQLIVRNVRNGQNVGVTIRPTRRGNVGVPAPAVAAAVVAGG